MKQSQPDTKTHTSTPNILSLLDFCKGLAIASIFLYHFDDKYMSLGWQGVHIFIILSGFGLTYSCLKQQAKSTTPINWRQWYLKRAQRILPTYWLACGMTASIMLCKIMLAGSNVVGQSIKTITQTILDIFLLRNFAWVTIFGYNGPLWFVPLIISLYLIFPFLYQLTTKHQTLKYLIWILITVIATSFLYRGIVLYFFDGLPIGYENIPKSCHNPIVPINRFPDTATFPFQRQAMFGLFPARLGEFMLGVTAAVLLFRKRDWFNNFVINYWALAIGTGIWLVGNQLTCAGTSGWIVSDFTIALGLMTLIINLAYIFEKNFLSIFKKVSWLGILSFYPFLVHEFLMVRIFPRMGDHLDPSFTLNAGLLGTILFELLILVLVVLATALLSWLLLLFDKSALPELVLSRTLSKFLKV